MPVIYRLAAVVTFLVLLLVPAAHGEVTYTFDIDADGSAWYIMEYRTLLDSPDRVDEFNEFRQVVEGNSTHRDEFESRMRNIVSEAGIATSRPMTASDFDISFASQDTATGSYGIVQYSFKWSNFATVSGSSITAGDVFFGGQYISTGDAFILKVPGGYGVSGVTPAPDIKRNDELIWNGPRNFNPGEPGVVFEKGISWLLGFVILLLVLGAGAYLYMKKKNILPGSTQTVKRRDTVDESSESAEVVSPEPSEPEKTQNSTTVSQTFFESDEEQVISLLKEHGGSMMQVDIVKNSGFSKSKTSALLNRMAGDGQIQRIKKGRENLIRLV